MTYSRKDFTVYDETCSQTAGLIFYMGKTLMALAFNADDSTNESGGTNKIRDAHCITQQSIWYIGIIISVLLQILSACVGQRYSSSSGRSLSCFACKFAAADLDVITYLKH